MKTMPAREFKARCLRVIEEVKKYRTPLVTRDRSLRASPVVETIW
jgi:hypothetical protein